ncbi:hypothetical protein CDL15_Pgr014421 [Punica granatum]|uniref:Uncharacterized protein n=1 Tax=Punica granatum TaxID=22663 RepID=A0A218WE48_PUNGR|nr:hypothetical protein CDL15_Pgr014421 [Punica granatum]PKI64839.1 hypothetical protein CRG98_014754 [Punica granatum]
MDHMSISVSLSGDLTDSLRWLRDENFKHGRPEECPDNESAGLPPRRPPPGGHSSFDWERNNHQVHPQPKALEDTVPSSRLIFLRSYPITMIKRKETAANKAKKCPLRVDDHPKIIVRGRRGKSTRGRNSSWLLKRAQEACCSGVKSTFQKLISCMAKLDVHG